MLGLFCFSCYLKGIIVSKNDRLRLGYYAHYPTILEPSPGPWGGMEIFHDHPVDAWRKILNWLKSVEVNYVVAVISPKFRDNIYHDWPFHYVCDLEQYPEARMFPAELIERHRNLTNQVVDIAEQMGIDMYFTHFNFYAPRGFIESHPRIREKYRRTRGQRVAGHDSCNYMNTLFGNICWSDPDYQRFMKYCWAEFFRAIPKAKGLMVTAGEHNECECPQCRGTSLDKEDRRAAGTEMKLDFIRTFVEEMDHLGRHSLVRTWYLNAEPESFPKATAFLPKYHVFDCFDAPIDPYTEHEMKSGRHTYPMFVQNGENASQVLWFRPGYWQRIGKTLAEKNADGALIMDNIDWGMNGMTNPVAALNLEAFFRYVRYPDTDLTACWKEHLAGIFGEAAEGVFEALDLLSEFPMNITKIIFLGREGYTYGPIQPCDEEFAPDPWGVLCCNWLPPDWARGDVGRLRSYWDYLEDNPFISFDDLAATALPSGERCPLKVMEHVIHSAAQAIKMLEAEAKRVSPEGRGYLDGLTSSAHITLEHSTMLLNSMKTALLIRAARTKPNADRAVALAIMALEVHSVALNALKRQIGWMNALPHDTLDFRNWLRFRMPDFNSFEAIMFTPLSLMEEENDNLRQWIMQMDAGIDPEELPRPSMLSLSAGSLPPMIDKGWKKS